LSGEKIQSDRIRYYRELFKKKMENDKTTDLLNIKNEIIEIFKVNLFIYLGRKT
jgi:hypothetical protein